MTQPLPCVSTQLHWALPTPLTHTPTPNCSKEGDRKATGGRPPGPSPVCRPAELRVQGFGEHSVKSRTDLTTSHQCTLMEKSLHGTEKACPVLQSHSHPTGHSLQGWLPSDMGGGVHRCFPPEKTPLQLEDVRLAAHTHKLWQAQGSSVSSAALGAGCPHPGSRLTMESHRSHNTILRGPHSVLAGSCAGPQLALAVCNLQSNSRVRAGLAHNASRGQALSEHGQC